MKIKPACTTTAFTIIEILIALTIFGMVLGAIYSSWIGILRATKAGQEAAAQAQRQRIAAHTIEEALISARSFAADVQHYTFIGENGDPPTLSFVARLQPSFPRGGKFVDEDVRRVTFSVQRGANYERNLVLQQNPILMDMSEDEKLHPVVLARNVKDFTMSFWDNQSGEWVDEWSQTNQLPKLVMFSLSLGGADPAVSRIQYQVTRIVSLPSVMVPVSWQVPTLPPGAPGAPGGRGGVPGIPGGPGGPGRPFLPGQQPTIPGQMPIQR